MYLVDHFTILYSTNKQIDISNDVSGIIGVNVPRYKVDKLRKNCITRTLAKRSRGPRQRGTPVAKAEEPVCLLEPRANKQNCRESGQNKGAAKAAGT